MSAMKSTAVLLVLLVLLLTGLSTAAPRSVLQVVYGCDPVRLESDIPVDGPSIRVLSGGGVAVQPVPPAERISKAAPALVEAGVDVVNLAHRDVTGDATAWREQLEAATGVTFLSANLSLGDGAPPPWRRSVVVERDGVRTAFTGVAARSATMERPARGAMAGLEVGEPVGALEAILPELVAKADRVLVLADAPLSVVAGWAERFPEVSVFLASSRGGGDPTVPLGRVVLAPPGGSFVGILRFGPDGASGRVIRLADPEPAIPGTIDLQDLPGEPSEPESVPSDLSPDEPESSATAAEPPEPPAQPEKLTEVEPNDGPSQAQELPLGVTLEASVRGAVDNDRFAFSLEEPAFLELKVTGARGIDAKLAITDADRGKVATWDGRGPGLGEKLIQRLRRGDYQVTVASRGEKGSPGGARYSLHIREANLKGYVPPTAEIQAAIRRGLDWLAREQAEDGAWESSVSRPGVSGLALMAFVGEALPELEKSTRRSAEFFRRSFLPPGSFPRKPRDEAALAGSLVGGRQSHFLYAQAIAVLAMAEYCERYGDDADHEMTRHAVDLLLRSQNGSARPDVLGGRVPKSDPAFGGWRYNPGDRTSDLSASGWCLVALAAAREAGFAVPERVGEEFMQFCRGCYQEDERAYGYEHGGSARITNTTNAVGVLTTLMTVGGECPVVRDAIRRIRRYFPNWEAEGGLGRYPFYYWYYATRAMYVAGGDHWTQWQAVVCPMLLEHQDAEGWWEAAEDEERVGRAYSTSLAILILQLCSGNPPAYLKGLELTEQTYSCSQLVEDIEAEIQKAARDGRSKAELIRDLRALVDEYYGE